MTGADEFEELEAEARDMGIPWNGRPTVERMTTSLRNGRRISAIQWGGTEPELVLLHGGTQNAHTWDAVALALARPLLAIDLPGHGHSDWRDDARYHPDEIADEVAEMIAARAAAPVPLVGMSMGGLVALTMAARFPQLFRGLVMVDITPGHRTQRESSRRFFERTTFASFDDLFKHAATFSGRTDDRSRRSVRHNARERADGQWEWRHHLARGVDARRDYLRLWDDLAALPMPVMLVRAGRSPIVTDEQVAEFRARRPDARIELVVDAGHSVQRSQPRALAALLEDFRPS